jgi:hypothetical protein
MKLNQWFKASSRRVSGVAVAALFVGSMALAPVPAIKTENMRSQQLREYPLPPGGNPGPKIRGARGSQRREWQPVRMKVKKQGGHGYQR